MKLSIIIPAYNVEKYIDRCLHSVVSQDIPPHQYEIIVVDDGSNDLTPHILNDWSQKYDNIKIYTQQNSGQSVARNFGLTKAVGNYIFFVDADDIIEFNTLKNLIQISEHNELDILRFDFFNSENKTFLGVFDKLYSGTDFFPHCVGIWAPWLQLFRREYLINNRYFFKVGITSEDAELIPKVYLNSKKSMSVNINIYHYVYNPSSTTKERKYDIDRVTKRINSQLEVLKSNTRLRNEFIECQDITNTIDRTVIYPTFTDFCTMILLSKLPFKIAKQSQRQYIESDLYAIRLYKQSTRKHKLMFRIMNSSILFNLFYFSGIKSIYYRYKCKYE